MSFRKPCASLFILESMASIVLFKEVRGGQLVF
jgi:hypothetical protein